MDKRSIFLRLGFFIILIFSAIFIYSDSIYADITNDSGSASFSSNSSCVYFSYRGRYLDGNTSGSTVRNVRYVCPDSFTVTHNGKTYSAVPFGAFNKSATTTSYSYRRISTEPSAYPTMILLVTNRSYNPALYDAFVQYLRLDVSYGDASGSHSGWDAIISHLGIRNFRVNSSYPNQSRSDEEIIRALGTLLASSFYFGYTSAGNYPTFELEKGSYNSGSYSNNVIDVTNSGTCDNLMYFIINWFNLRDYDEVYPRTGDATLVYNKYSHYFTQYSLTHTLTGQYDTTCSYSGGCLAWLEQNSTSDVSLQKLKVGKTTGQIYADSSVSTNASGPFHLHDCQVRELASYFGLSPTYTYSYGVNYGDPTVTDASGQAKWSWNRTTFQAHSSPEIYTSVHVANRTLCISGGGLPNEIQLNLFGSSPTLYRNITSPNSATNDIVRVEVTTNGC